MNEKISRLRARQAATEEIELTHFTAVIRSHVSLLDLAGAGLVPTTLLVELDEIGRKTKDNPAAIPGDALAKMTPALDALAIAAFVDPPVTKKGGDDALAPSELSFADKYKVFMRLNREAEALRDFRPEPRESNGATHSGDDLPHAAVANTGD